MNNCRYSTIFWDLDGTLLDFLYSQRESIRMCLRKYGRTVTDAQIERYSDINDYYWQQFELGRITKDEILVQRFRKWFGELGITIDASEFNDAYEEALGSVFSYLDDSLNLCSQLKESGIKQYIVTNGSFSTATNKIHISGFDRIMDGVFISDAVGVPKPEKAFFDYCLERIPEKDPKRILIVGDSLSSDMLGGVKYGLVTCWYNALLRINNRDFTPDYEIMHLEQVKDILMK